MEQTGEDGTDASSIRPVSSLRTHFENMLRADRTRTTPSPNSSRQPSPSALNRLERLDEPKPRADGRISLDIPRSTPTRAAPVLYDYNVAGIASPESRAPQTPSSRPPRPRPLSMGPISPPRSPPRVTVDSPRSPPKFPDHPKLTGPLSSRESSRGYGNPPSPRSGSPPQKQYKLPGRSTTPGIEARQSLFLQAPTPTPTSTDPRKALPFGNDISQRSSYSTATSPVPPPINRAGKPKNLSKPQSTGAGAEKANLAPLPSPGATDERISPFSTPPSSDESNPADSPSPPPINESFKPKFAAKRESYFLPPPGPVVPERRREPKHEPFSRVQNIYTKQPVQPRVDHTASDLPEDRPGLPPRRPDLRQAGTEVRATSSRPPPPEPPVRRSMDTLNRPVALISEANPKFMPPPKRASTFGIGALTGKQGVLNSVSYFRASNDLRRDAAQPTHASRYRDDSDDESEQPYDKSALALLDYPNPSEANRRPPVFTEWPKEIPTKYETKLFAVCGEYVCTTGYVTRVWSLITGQLLMNLSHGDTVKVTSIAFRPAKGGKVEDEGKQLWLGTNVGEIHEVDIPKQSVVLTKHNAHPRREIIKIYRYASEMWSLDDDGKLHIWPPDETGTPILGQTPNTFRIPRGHTYSIIVGSELWVAFGKEIRVYKSNSSTHNLTEAFEKPLSQTNTGEITSGAMISSQPDRLYFGHTDGKVTIWGRHDYSCLAVVNVSSYKLSSLVGVGDYLWAGYITGMIYVYDTTSQPWKVMKDWKAHDNPVTGITVDRSSVWKLDRLQVVSLGTDLTLRVWDGMLKDDWLESQMQENDHEFCDFREVTAQIMTWNAGASKPTSLRYDEQDINFFRDLLSSHDPSDILVFGFQELVDLEDKKITAKSIFKSKSSKKKDATDEHMSRQYRAWRDFLIRSLDEHVPSQSYTLLHTANLVGLFTCIFVKSSELAKIRDVKAAQVKLGMGGLHGNKGALVVRFILDDSSFCFINCHLAAGQSHTSQRNYDIAAIMETSALPSHSDSASRSDIFVGGGDGSMILDHEICILNGDLNYRIDTMGRDTVIAAVKSNNLAKLLERDQLLLSFKRHPNFRLRSFTEAPITFAPTYKYDVGTNTYDTSEKKRSPAWCDRLLYRGKGRVRQLDYRRHEVRVSDHRPVSGKFKIRVKTISPKRRMTAWGNCELKFEEAKHRIAYDIKLEYLVNVLGISSSEAKSLLNS